jgi:methionyl aminopeptidase
VSVTRKSAAQIATMRRAGRVVAEMHEAAARAAVPGATTADLDRACADVLDRRGAKSSFLGYHGYPAVACISPNEVIVHGIPDDRVLDEGDIVSIDCGAIVDGWHADAAITVPVGAVDESAQHLITVTRRALDAAIDALSVGAALGDVGAAVEVTAHEGHLGLVREYTGHGIGTQMHEDPPVPNYGRPGKGFRLAAGHVVAIEPMLTEGRPASRTLADGWTVVTADGKRAAHFEHTIAVTDDGPRILTLPWGE